MGMWGLAHHRGPWGCLGRMVTAHQPHFCTYRALTSKRTPNTCPGLSLCALALPTICPRAWLESLAL